MTRPVPPRPTGPARRRRSLSVLLLLLSLAALPVGGARAQAERSRPDLRPLPEVSLEAAEPAVREQVAALRTALDRLLERPDAPPELLASAFADLGEAYLVYDLGAAAEVAFLDAIALAGETPRWRYLLGTLYQLDRRLEEAAAEFRRVLELAPDDLAAQARLAEVELERGDPEAAEALWRPLLEREGFAAAAHFGLGQIELRRGAAAAARDHFEAALRLQPAASLVHYHLAQAYRELGDLERARAELERRGEERPRFPDPRVLEVQSRARGVGALLSLGRMSLALGAIPEAEARFRSAVEQAPESAAAHRALAGLLQDTGRIDEALVEYQRAVELAPDDIGLRYAVALLLRDHPDPEGEREQRALGYLDQALERAPDFFPAWTEKASILERQGRVEEAQAALGRALELEPGELELWLWRGRLLGRLDRQEAALALLADAPATTPGERLAVALALRDVGRLDAARPVLEAILAAPASPPVAARAHFQLGNLEVESGELEAALDHYRAAVELEPEMVEAHFNLATLAGRLGHYREAAEHHNRVLAYRPADPRARLGEALALLLAGDAATARDRLEQAVRLHPREPAYAHLLARVLVTASDPEVRDPEKGLALASRLFDFEPTIDHGETLAMALAEAGRFEEAVNVQRQLVEQLEELDDPRLPAARSRLAAYRTGQPVREPWRDPSPGGDGG